MCHAPSRCSTSGLGRQSTADGADGASGLSPGYSVDLAAVASAQRSKPAASDPKRPPEFLDIEDRIKHVESAVSTLLKYLCADLLEFQRAAAASSGLGNGVGQHHLHGGANEIPDVGENRVAMSAEGGATGETSFPGGGEWKGSPANDTGGLPTTLRGPSCRVTAQPVASSVPEQLVALPSMPPGELSRVSAIGSMTKERSNLSSGTVGEDGPGGCDLKVAEAWQRMSQSLREQSGDTYTDNWAKLACAGQIGLRARWAELCDAKEITHVSLLGSFTNSGDMNEEMITAVGTYRPAAVVQQFGDRVVGNSWVQPCVIHPDGRFSMSWALSATTLVMWDMLTIPLFAFDLDVEGSSIFLTLLALTFWTLDLGINALTGHHREGVIEMRPSKTCMAYLRTWGIIDILVVLLDWVFSSLVYGKAGGARTTGFARLGKYRRVQRVARMLRLFRLWKGAKAFNFGLTVVTSQRVHVIFKLFVSVLGILIVNHYIACIFYALAAYSTDGGPTWLQMEDLDLNGKAEMYVSALHWSLTQFTPATNNIVPANATERVFASCVVIFAMVTFSTFVSSITGAMAKLAQLNSERTVQEDRIKKFLSEKQLSLELGQRIWFFWEKYASMQEKVTKEQDVPFLARLPLSAKMQLALEMYSRHMQGWPLMRQIKESSLRVVTAVCGFAIKEGYYLPDEDIFIRGVASKGMYIPVVGKLLYQTGFDFTYVNADDGKWLSEVALWAHWFHRGQLLTSTQVDILYVSARRFERLLATTESHNSVDAGAGVARYAQRFLAIAHASKQIGGNVDDLFGCGADEVEQLTVAAEAAFAKVRNTLHEEGSAENVGGMKAADYAKAAYHSASFIRQSIRNSFKLS